MRQAQSQSQGGSCKQQRPSHAARNGRHAASTKNRRDGVPLCGTALPPACPALPPSPLLSRRLFFLLSSSPLLPLPSPRAMQFSLHQVLLACMLTGLSVSLLVSALHSQWQWGEHGEGLSANTPGIINSRGIESSATQQLRSKLAQMSEVAAAANAVALGGGGGGPLTPAQLAKCPSCPAPTALSASPSPAAPALTTSGGSSMDAAFDSYIALHSRILSKDAGVPQRFVIVRPQAQMNNRLRVIVSGIVLGMLTQRAMLVEFSDGYYASISDVFSPPIAMDLKNYRAQLPSGAGDTLSMDDLETILCTDYNTRFQGVSIDVGSPPNLIPFFWRNPHHHAQLSQWFGGVEEHIYQLVSKRFLVPSQTVKDMMQRFREKNFALPAGAGAAAAGAGAAAGSAQGVYKLGIHLRWGGDHRPQPVLDSEWADMVECAAAVVPRSFRTTSGLVVFVAADTDESRSKARALLSAKFPQARVVFYEQWLRSDNVPGVQAALTELLLLSECDNLILTPASSYGEQAQALAGKPGYYVKSPVPNPARIQYSNTHQIAPNCLRPYSSQPTVEHFSTTIKQASCYHPDMHGISF